MNKTKGKLRNDFRIGLTKSCVIGSFIHNKKSKLYILFLILKLMFYMTMTNYILYNV